MSLAPTPEWMERFRETVNDDPEMAVIGDWFTVEFKLSFEGHDYVLMRGIGHFPMIENYPVGNTDFAGITVAEVRSWSRGRNTANRVHIRPAPLDA